MRVFSVEMLVKEEGAATVQAALNRLKKETQAVAADMKVTAQAVTNTGSAMQGAANQTQIAGDRAAKAAIGFAAVGQSIARTGSLTADAGTRIIEAGSQISAMFGAGGLVVSGILAGLAAVTTAFFSTKKEVADFKKTLDGLTDTANLQGLQDELDKIVKGTASKEGKDAITAQAQELVRLQEEYKKYADVTGAASSEQIELAKQINTLKAELEDKRDRIADITQRIAIASDKERFHTTVLDREAEAERRITAATKARAEALKLLDEALTRNAAVRAAIQERERARIGTMPSTVGQTTFGTGLGVAGSAERMAEQNAPAIAAAAAQSFKTQMTAEMQGITQGLATMTIPIDESLMQAVRLDNLQATLAEGIGQSIEGGIISGLEMGLASGNIGDAFRAMGQSIVQSMAQAMVRVALAAIKFGELLTKIKTFMMNNPALAVVSAIALLTIARSMGGGVSGTGVAAVGGAGGLTYAPMSAAAPMSPTQLIFGQTSATTAAGMTPRQSMNVTIIGPNDPSAQRAIQELMTKANSRGRVG